MSSGGWPFIIIICIRQDPEYREMQPRYDIRRFHRSPKMTPLSPQALPLQSVVSSREFMSPVARNHSDSGDDGYQNDHSFSVAQPIINSIMERLALVEAGLREEKSERLDEYTKLTKMIKQMQCKHSAIIYDTEIRYNKSSFIPQLYSTINNKAEHEKSLKKVSNYVMDKNLPSAKVEPARNNGKNLKMSDVALTKKTQAPEQAPKISQNPERGKEPVSVNRNQHRRTGSGPVNIVDKDIEAIVTNINAENLCKFQQKVMAELGKKVQKCQEETTTQLSKKIQQLKQGLRTMETKVNSQLTTMNTSLSKQKQQPIQSPLPPNFLQDIAAFREKVTAELNKNTAQISKYAGDLSRTSGEYGRLFTELNRQSNQFAKVYTEANNNSNEIIKNRMELTKYENQLAKQAQQLAVNSSQVARLNGELAKTSTLGTSVANLNSQMQKLQIELHSLEENTKNNALGEISKISYKLEQMYGIFNDFSSPLRERLDEISAMVNEQEQKINSIRNFCESDYHSISAKLTQVQNYFVLKLQANEREITKSRDQCDQLSRAVKQQETGKLEQEKSLDGRIEAKVGAKVEALRVLNIREIHSFNGRIQAQILGLLQRHINYVQTYLKNVQEKQKYLQDRFISSTQDQPQASINASTVVGGRHGGGEMGNRQDGVAGTHGQRAPVPY